MFETDFNVDFTMKQHGEVNCELDINKTLWKSCVANNSKINYEGIECNDNLHIHWILNGIKYENELYTEMRANLPDVNDTVVLEEGEGKVLSVDVIKRELKVKMFLYLQLLVKV